MHEFEEVVCVSFHVITFGEATDNKLGAAANSGDCAECGVPYPERAKP
jgi:hypothetical protein